MKSGLSRLAGLTALAAAAALAGCNRGSDLNSAAAANQNAALPSIPAPNGGDWTQVVQETPEGGWRMGNPDAPVKLVEYASATCPHCAEFEEAGGETLRNRYVRSGQVSWEYRPFMIFPTDPGIFALLRCQGPGAFFTLIEQIYDTQGDWAGRLQSLSQEQAQQIQSMSPAQRSRMLLQTTQLDQFFRQRGMPQSRIDSCLADQSVLTRLAEITTQGSEQHEVTGTPSFIINGQMARDVSTPPYWPQLEQRLRAAIGS